MNSVARLMVQDTTGNEREVEITRAPFSLGRQGDNDLVLLDNRVSRRHARILHDGKGYTIEDAESRHGTFVNGERVTTRLLKTGDEISLGVSDSYRLTFLLEAPVIPNLLEEIGKSAGSPAPQLHHLGILLQMAEVLHRAPALEEVLTTVVDSALQLADADRGLLFLVDDNGDLRLRMVRSREGGSLPTDIVDYSHAVVDRVARVRQEEVVLEDELTQRTPAETGILPAKVRGVVALPLQKLPVMESSGDTMRQVVPQLMGVLYLDTRLHPTAVTGLDRQVLQTLAVEGATVIENAKLFRRSREQERTQHEMALARGIQQTLLPRALPETGYFELHSITMPCQTVGGDYYDVISLPGRRYGITVADVSGKGLPAAMMSVMLQGAFAAVAAGDPDLAALFRTVNDFLCQRTPPEMYATVFYGVLAPSGQFDYVNAAHPAPLVLRRAGGATVLHSENFPLGMFEGTTFNVGRVELEPGDEVLIFSDGVTEAQNTSREFLGEQRLTALAEACAGLKARDVCSKLVAAVQDFAGLAPQADDLTVSVVHFGPTENGRTDESNGRH
ncbi:MAG TPA: SpoIIE family protein phosphatase [Terriglobia bacterium]|nr:SpoIIE family protein phosphatase [Terriglobia bacterium]